jgi:hypothetical protein
MPDLLNYQPSSSAVYYTPPKRIDVTRTVVGFTAAAVLAAIGAFIYAHIQPELNSLYLRVGAVAVAGGAVAGLAVVPVRYGRVRIPFVAALLGALLALLTLYVMWLKWLSDFLTEAGYTDSLRTLVMHPVGMFDVIRALSGVGTWSYKGNIVSGFPLVVMWLGEAGVMLAAGVLAPLHWMGNDDPVCNACGTKCKRVPKLPRFSTARKEELLAAVENRRFEELATHQPPADEDEPEIALALMSCEKCKKTHVLSVNLIRWDIDGQGIAKVKTEPLINQLLVTPDEAERIIIVCCDIVKAREAELVEPGEVTPPG